MAEEKPKKKKEWVLQAAVFSALRRAHRNSPEYRQTLANAKSEYFITCKNGNQARRVQYECKACGNKGSRKNVYVDHREPVIAVTGFQGFETYIKRLFCGTVGLDILCKSCHDRKTKHENFLRRQYKKEKLNV